MNIDPVKIRKDFPILSQYINGNPLVYFDNAATTQKPQSMIDELVNYYSTFNSNIHRGVHTLSQKATTAFEETRELISEIYNCSSKEVIFTKNDTEALNLIAYSLGRNILFQGDNIVISDLEHHSNIVPWQILSKDLDIEIRYVQFDEFGQINIADLEAKVDKHTKILSLNWCSNTFGIINDAEKIIQTVKNINDKTVIILDAAQSVPHKKFDFQKLNADFVTFSAHKLCGPTGVGVLIGKEEHLVKMPPYMSGGDMIKDVSREETTFNELPYKFEAGTPNIADVIAFKKSLGYLNNLGFENILKYENYLAEYLLDRLSELNFVDIYGLKRKNGEWEIGNREKILTKNKISLISFNLKDIHAHDVGSLLDEDGIAVRSGHHCTQLIMKQLNIPASVRASLYIYNTSDEIDKMIESLIRINKIFK